MGQDSKIEWTDATFNPWRGCAKVSPGCQHCYAETLSARNPRVLGEWGPAGTRVVASESYWRLPRKWDAQAAAHGRRSRVFCASLADVFEDRPELDIPRGRLMILIRDTPHLDWLLLTKRPENVRPLLERLHADGDADGITAWECLPAYCNLWLGVSVEDQARADERIPALLAIPAAVRFLSCEPLLGPVDLNAVRWQLPDSIGVVRGGVLGDTDGREFSPRGAKDRGIDWVIFGGESGPNARPMRPDWARSIRDQCVASGTAFFFKQWGEWASDDQTPGVVGGPQANRTWWLEDDEDGEFFELGRDAFAMNPGVALHRYGKKHTGRLLDGREWSEFPRPLAPAGPNP